MPRPYAVAPSAWCCALEAISSGAPHRKNVHTSQEITSIHRLVRWDPTGAFSRLRHASSRLQGEVHMHGVVGEAHALRRAFEHACVDQGGDVAMHALHVALHTACHFADGQLALPGHGAQDFPALGGEHLPQQFDRSEGDELALCLSGQRSSEAPLAGGTRGNAQGDGFHALASHASTSAQKSSCSAASSPTPFVLSVACDSRRSRSTASRCPSTPALRAYAQGEREISRLRFDTGER